MGWPTRQGSAGGRRARAVDGAAYEAVVDAVAAAFGLLRAEVSISSGARGRDKVVELAGDGDVLAARLAALLT